MKKYRLQAAVLTVCAVALWLWWTKASNDAAPAASKTGSASVQAVPVTLGAAQMRVLNDDWHALGNAEAREGVVITVQETGIVDRVHFIDGAQVSKDALLVTLQDAEERARLAEAQARVQDAQQQLHRLLNLSSDKAVSRSAIDDRQSILNVALAQQQLAQASLDKRRITAPFSGTLGARKVSPGALLTPGTVVTTLDDISRMRVQFSLPESALGAVHVGMSISARTRAYPEQIFIGNITHIDVRIATSNRSAQMRAEIVNSAQQLRPGMLMEITINSKDKPVLVIPEGALVGLGKQHYVWQVNAQKNQVSKQLVQIGRRAPGWVEIIDGLQSDAEVVVEGTHKLRDGQSVQVISP